MVLLRPVLVDSRQSAVIQSTVLALQVQYVPAQLCGVIAAQHAPIRGVMDRLVFVHGPDQSGVECTSPSRTSLSFVSGYTKAGKTLLSKTFSILADVSVQQNSVD